MSGDADDNKNFQHLKYDWLKPDKVRYVLIQTILMKCQNLFSLKNNNNKTFRMFSVCALRFKACSIQRISC